MRWQAWFVTVAVTMCMGFAGSGASAGEPGEKREARKDAKDARKEAKEAKEDLRDARKELREAIKDGGPDSAAAREGRMDLKDARQKLKESRNERRDAAKGALKAKWGADFLKKPAVRAELRLHAMRMAKLHHMKRVADSAGKKPVEERVDKLTEKEQARHQTRMDALKAKNGDEP